MKRSIATVIVGPHTLLREGLTSLISESIFKIVGSINKADEWPLLFPERVGLVLVGIPSASPENLDYIRRIARPGRSYKIAVVAETSASAEQLDIAEIHRSGADAYIINLHSRDVLLRSLELVILGQKLVILSRGCELQKVAELGPAQPRPDGVPVKSLGNGSTGLSERELEILSCLARGVSNKLIGRTFKIAESTVKIHLRSILRKIQVQNRTQAAIWAIQNGLSVMCDLPRDLSTDDTPPLSSTEIFVSERSL